MATRVVTLPQDGTSQSGSKHHQSANGDKCLREGERVATRVVTLPQGGTGQSGSKHHQSASSNQCLRGEKKELALREEEDAWDHFVAEIEEDEWQLRKKAAIAELSSVRGLPRMKGLRNLSHELKTDKEVAIAIVTQNGHELRFLPMWWQNKEIGIAAVTSKGTAIMFLSEELRADEEVCLAAAAQIGTAFLSTESESYKKILEELESTMDGKQAHELMERLTRACMHTATPLLH